VGSFKLRAVFPQGKSPHYILDKRLCGHQSWSGCSGKEKKNPFSAPA